VFGHLLHVAHLAHLSSTRGILGACEGGAMVKKDQPMSLATRFTSYESCVGGRFHGLHRTVDKTGGPLKL
jgi:hypothetical protein